MFRILGIVFLFVASANFFLRPSDYGMIGLMLLGAMFVSMPLFIRRGALRLYAQKADRDMTVRWEISDDRVSSKTDLAASDLSWTAFVKVARLPQGFLLYPNDSVFLWLPVHAFASAADVERFAALATVKVNNMSRPPTAL